MPTFVYKALAPSGASESGSLEAAALRKLRARKLSPIAVKPGKELTQRVSALSSPLRGSHDSAKQTAVGKPGTAALPVAQPVENQKATRQPLLRRKAGKHLALPFYRKLYQLHKNGMPVGDAVHLMSQRMSDPQLKSLSESLYRDLSEGRTLAMALQGHPDIVDPVHPHLIEAGESTGNVAPILKNLIASEERAAALKKQLQGAMAYPVFLSLAAMVVVAIFLFFLLPNIEAMLARAGSELNPAAKLMIGVSDFALTQGPFVLVVLLLSIAVILQWRKHPVGRERTDRALLKLPLFGQLVYDSEITRLSHLMAVMLGNGVNATETLRLASTLVRNRVLMARYQAARTLIHDGAAFSMAFRRYGLLDPMDADILGIGEGTGNLSDSFHEIGQSHGQRLAERLGFTTKAFAGCALGFAFLLVTVIVFAVILSIMDMSQGLLSGG